jgi:hypothetical protein
VKLYKYFSEQRWARAFLDGSLRFRTLSYFQDLEDKNVREDDKEGVSVFRPEGGLVLNNQTQGTTHVLRGYSFESAVKQHEIFVFCASRTLADELIVKFNAVACVEISNVPAFCDRIEAALPSGAKFPGPPRQQRIGQRVRYYHEGGDCNPRWALPDIIAVSKRDTYAWQKEFRLVLSLTDALEFEKAAMTLVPPGRPRAPQCPGEHRSYDVATGSLRDICRLHEFAAQLRQDHGA